MKYSLCTELLYVAVGEHGPLWADTEGIMDSLDFAKKHGFDAVEFFGWADRDLEKIAAKSKETGVDVQAICAKDCEFLGCPDKVDLVVKGFEESIPAAKTLNCPFLILNGNFFPREEARDVVYTAMVEALKQIAPMAEAAGVTALFEPCTGNFFTNSADPIAMIKEVGSDNVKLLYDIFHYQNMEGNITNTIKDNLDVIAHIHGAGCPMRCELSVGEINYNYILNFLKEIGYEGCFGVEFLAFQDKDAKVDACKAVIDSAK